MFDLEKFIYDKVVKRERSMFYDDIDMNREKLSKKIKGKTVLVIGGAGSIGSSFIKAILPFEPSTLVVVDTNENALAELTRDLRSTKGMYIPKDYIPYPMDFASDVFEKMFRKLLYQTLRALESPAFSNRLVRCIYELRTLTINGEAPNVFGCTKCGKKEALHWFSGKTARMLCDHCVNELRRKPENMAALPTYQKVQESTVYTMQYIMTAKLAKLYTFSVSDQVLWELQQCIREYMKYYINHSFKSLKILEEVENMI